MPISLTNSEKRNGLIYFAVSLFILPNLLSLAGLTFRLDPADLNLGFYWINLAFVVWVFRRFLLKNLLIALDRVFPVVWYAMLGYLGYTTLGEMLSVLIYSLSPEFVNANDVTVSALIQASPMLAFAVAFLAPITEETFYRGLVFRGLWDKNPILAYLVSIALFSAVHVTGYIGLLSPLHLLLSFLQYLPAGYCLAFVYRRSGTIICPMLVHIAVNTVAVFSILR